MKTNDVSRMPKKKVKQFLSTAVCTFDPTRLLEAEMTDDDVSLFNDSAEYIEQIIYKIDDIEAVEDLLKLRKLDTLISNIYITEELVIEAIKMYCLVYQVKTVTIKFDLGFEPKKGAKNEH